MHRPRLRAVSNSDPAVREPAGKDVADGVNCLEYMADLILELRGLASHHGYTTLAGLLEIAHQEAKAQARMR